MYLYHEYDGNIISLLYITYDRTYSLSSNDVFSHHKKGDTNIHISMNIASPISYIL